MSNWNQVPPPPAPTGINQFPATPPAVQVSQAKLPDQKQKMGHVGEHEIYEELTGQTITVTAQWKKVVSCTASQATPFSQNDSVAIGTSTTETHTTSFSASLGVTGSLGSISESLTKTFSHSVTLSELKTIRQTFQVTPKKGTVSAIWWQLVHTYTITGTKTLFLPFRMRPQRFTNQMVSAAETFVSTIFPANPDLTTQGFESFT